MSPMTTQRVDLDIYMWTIAARPAGHARAVSAWHSADPSTDGQESPAIFASSRTLQSLCIPDHVVIRSRRTSCPAAPPRTVHGAACYTICASSCSARQRAGKASGSSLRPVRRGSAWRFDSSGTKPARLKIRTSLSLRSR